MLLTRDEAALALPLVRRDLTPDERSAALRRAGSAVRHSEEWLADMADDPEGAWRSPWLAACAVHAGGR